MTHVVGVVPENPALPGFSPLARATLWENAVEALAHLHDIKPGAVGLGDYGSAGDYNHRQRARWRRRNAEGPIPPALTMLEDRLTLAPPRQTSCAIVHGDYRLGNWIVDGGSGALAAIVDWELSTLGDPLSDLAYLMLSFAYPSTGSVLPGLAGAPLPAGMPDQDRLAAHYAVAAGCDLPDDWPRHRALALFRSASIALSVFRRRAASRGLAPAANELAIVESLAALGLDLLSSSRSMP